MKIKKGDNVKIISGKDKGKRGKVIMAIPKSGKVVVENANIITKHIKSRKSGSSGQKITMPSPINVSNVSLICKKCGKTTRIGYLIFNNGEKRRICKKCRQEC